MVFRSVKIPRVMAYIFVGLFFGSSFTNFISLDLVANLSPVTDIALGLMGVMIGGELKKSVFQQFGRQLVFIVLGEGLLAFLLVSILVTLFTANLPLGLILGALASATAPAATIDVLWEYKSKGPLTTTLLGIIALDDSLSLILFGFSLAFAKVLLDGSSLSLVTGLVIPLTEIFGALALGGLAGWIVKWVLKILPEREDVLVLSSGVMLLLGGLAHWAGLPLILTEMAFGASVVNLAPRTSRQVFEALKDISPPIYILFFILVGAQLQVELLTQIGLVGIIYVIGRTVGKMAGSWMGGSIGKAEESVKKYLGFALFSQAGVAVGLSLAVAQEFSEAGAAAQEVGLLVVNIIAATTFFVQIIGPPFVKFAISKAGEIPLEEGAGDEKR